MSERHPAKAAPAAEFLPRGTEWGTLALVLMCYAMWQAALWWLPGVSLLLAVIATGMLIAFHSSLTHEAVHGHPFRSPALNEALMFLPLNPGVPYRRFRDTHLAHHEDERLTDPYDDPEANYQDPKVWSAMPGWQKRLLRINNTMLGRVTVGVVIGQYSFMKEDWRLARGGDKAVARAWLLHAIGLVPVLALVAFSPLPLWAYLPAAFIGLGLLKIRTFLEHRAHDAVQARTVVVEDRGPLALLFLNNNLHVVHHMHPGVPWYALPRLYRAQKARFLAANQGYVYRSYREIFRSYFLRAKDPVPHPLWQQGE